MRAERDAEMTGNVYTAVAAAVCAAGHIDQIGVVSDAGKTAVGFAGVDIQRKYLDGQRKIQIIYNITGACDTDDGQQGLIGKLCDICEAVAGTRISVDGFGYVRTDILSLPSPVMHDQHIWIYSARIGVSGYYKE
jgi:hypothetical protein